jgi:hypothetical protein
MDGHNINSDNNGINLLFAQGTTNTSLHVTLYLFHRKKPGPLGKDFDF